MFTGYIDITGNHIKDGLKNDLRSTSLIKNGNWLASNNGGFFRDLGDYREYTILVPDANPCWKSRKFYQTWWSTVPHRPYWKKKLISYWLKIKRWL